MYPRIIVFLALLCASSVSLACSCRFVGTPAQQIEGSFKASDAVFVGLVQKIRPLDAYAQEITLQVKRAWKGNVRRTTLLRVNTQSSLCGLSMAKGAEYLIYANKYDSSNPKSPLTTTACTRTGQTKYASDDLKVLTKKQAVQVQP